MVTLLSGTRTVVDVDANWLGGGLA